MNTPQPKKQFPSRRHFLNASAATTLVAGFGGLSETAPADEPRSRRDRVVALDLGVRPEISSPGPVIVPKKRITFVTFYADQFDESGAKGGSGTAVIGLEGCGAWKTRCAGDEVYADHPLDLESLAACETYRVRRSTWVRSWEAAFGRFENRMQHFVFTFLGVDPGVCSGGRHFECLAQDLTVDFFPTESFDEMLTAMEISDLAA